MGGDGGGGGGDFNPRPVFTGMTNKFYQKNCFTSEFLLFCRLKDPKDYYSSKYIEFTESSMRNPQAKRRSPIKLVPDH